MNNNEKLIRNGLAGVSGSDTGKYFFFAECQTGHCREGEIKGIWWPTKTPEAGC